MTEEQLRKELKDGIIRRVYYLHGKESFLVGAYAAQITDKCFPPETAEEDKLLNLVRFSSAGGFDMSEIADFAGALPVFAQRRVVLLNDLDAEKLKADELDALLTIVGGVSESTCLIIYGTGFVPDLKKVKTKKLITAIEGEKGKNKKRAAVIGFEKMTESKIVERIERRVSQSGCNISRDSAKLLSRLCLNNYTLIQSELAKLCAYANYQGEITEKSIELLTARQLESVVFKLAEQITAKRGRGALLLLDELLEQGNAPVQIVSILSSTFIDFYRAKIATAANVRTPQIIADFGYPPNRAFLVEKALSASSRLTSSKIRSCIAVLCDADYRLKSSPANMSDKDRLILESTIARLLSLC
jgi:DNA polymerase-3 subunit delta